MKHTIDYLSKTDVITASDSNAGNLASLKALRKLWLEVHLWLGLALGLFLSIFGITGSILVFHAEINELLNPRLLTVAVPDGNPVYKPLAEIFQAGQAAMPQKAAHTFATYPRNNEAAFKLVYSAPLAGGVTESWEVFWYLSVVWLARCCCDRGYPLAAKTASKTASYKTLNQRCKVDSRKQRVLLNFFIFKVGFFYG